MRKSNADWIKKIADVLQSGGRFLFTAPNESGSFPPDVMTGRPQFSLGYEEYRKALEAEGVSLVGTHRDEGENHYYFAQKDVTPVASYSPARHFCRIRGYPEIMPRNRTRSTVSCSSIAGMSRRL
jgi:hypothetical protein